jgi:glycolate dehydrogenase FAD-linked subunit
VTSALERDLRALVGESGIGSARDPRFGRDATEARGLEGRPDAVVLPDSADQVAAIVRWCYERDVAMVPRGGGTGFSGGCVPVTGGVVVDLARMNRVRSFEPLLWRMQVEAGLRTGDVRRLARENGLLFPPDPGAAEQSQIGGNIATNAGGPHAFKYGVTGRWVTGIEAVLPPGDVIRVGGPIRKDVAGYDIAGLLTGSEGTLGIITAAWLRLIPAPEASAQVVGFYAGVREGCAAIETVLGSGIVAAAIEFLDDGALGAARGACPFEVPPEARFMVLTEADGGDQEVARAVADLREALSDGALAIHLLATPAETTALWRWRDGVSIAVEALRGGKVSEDIVVPVDRLAEAIEATLELAAEHQLKGCSWGHAGDGNLHSTFMINPGDAAELERARAASARLYSLAAGLGGSISGEHGLGWVKRGHRDTQWTPATIALQDAIKRTIDPKNLLNPGKKS